jgi:hypothetical protein
MRKTRNRYLRGKWNYHACGEESVTACAKSKDDIKQTKTT